MNLWFQANLLSLNVSKATFMIFGRKNLSANIMIDNVSLLKQEESKFLGVILSADLKWHKHTDIIINKASKTLVSFQKFVISYQKT